METPTPSTSSSTRTTAILLVAIAFVAGALIGFAGGRVYSIYHGPMHGPGADFMRDRMLHHLDHELSLTPQQHEQVKQIIDRHHQRMEEISGGVRPQMRQEIDAAGREIAAVLTPAQKQKFEALRLHMEHRGSRRR